MAGKTDFSPQCPVPRDDGERIVLAHGGGGRMTQRLIETVFLPAFANPALSPLHDGAVVELGGSKLAFSTDSYVVKPLFFAGGNIGDLAVNGTVNDLAMCGARPVYLSCGFILEEGLPLDDLRAIVNSMRCAAESAGVMLVTGDTKVVDRGKGDGVFLNTAGIGVLVREDIRPASVRPGDVLLVSGDLGAHGVAILSQREGLGFEADVESDTASLWPAVRALFDAGIEVHCLRDLTRGGLASALNEIASGCGLTIEVEERRVPVRDAVRHACEMLGFDPLYVANEGRFAAFLPEAQAEAALTVLRSCEVSAGAVRAGTVRAGSGPMVILRTAIGGNRSLDMLSGDQLPRIC